MASREGCGMYVPVLLFFVDDETRVHLNEGPDYINANFVNVSMLLFVVAVVSAHVVVIVVLSSCCGD